MMWRPEGLRCTGRIPPSIPEVRWLLAVSVLALATVAGCGDDADGEAAPQRIDAEVYAAVVSWFADQQPPPEDDELGVVFLDDLGEPIPIEVQVELLDVLEDELNVRFIDDDEEAVDEDVEGMPVHDDGLLLRLGPVVDRQEHVEVDVEQYEAEDEVSRYRVVVESSGDAWRVVGEPEDVPVPDSPS